MSGVVAVRRGSALPYRFFNLDDVADYLHLTRADVEALVRSGGIPFEKHGDRVVFPKKEIDAWASRRILGLSSKGLKAYHKTTSAKAHDLSKEHRIIPELVKENYLVPTLTAKTKASVIRQMVDLANATGLVPNPQELLRSLVERERLGTTALTGGIALLHPRNQEPYMFDDSFVVLGRTIQPIPFGSPDGATTDLFFLVCCQDDRIHLHVLARLCMICHYTSLLLELRDAADASAMYKALVESEEEVVRSL